jgi:hypothetical protein
MVQFVHAVDQKGGHRTVREHEYHRHPPRPAQKGIDGEECRGAQDGEIAAGLNPATRIAVAEKRLALRRDSVTEIALELGFSSSQYFATVFKRFTGMTPGGSRIRTRRP